MAIDNVSIVKSVYDAFNTQDVLKLLSVLDPSFELRDMATGQTFERPEGFLEWVRPWIQATPDAKTELGAIFGAGDLVFTEHVARGTHTGTFVLPGGEFPPTNRRFEARFGEVFELRNGKVLRLRAYWDTASLMMQLGLNPTGWLPR